MNAHEEEKEDEAEDKKVSSCCSNQCSSTKSLHCASTHEHNSTPLPFLFRGSGQPSVASRTGDQRGDHGGWLALVAVLLVPALVGDERPSENLSVDLLNERPPQLSG